MRAASLVMMSPLLVAGCLRAFEPLASPDAQSPSVPLDAGVLLDLDEPISIGFGPSELGVTGDGGSSQPGGRAEFDLHVLPLMKQHCVSCHGGSGIGPPFMKGEPYDSLVAYKGMITRDPTHSLLVTKGPHNGPYFSNAELLVVLDWLAIEAAALPPSVSGTVATPPMTPKTGFNAISLDPLGADFLGASITFDATVLNGALKVTALKVDASGPSGLHVVHPLFLGIDKKGVKHPDPIDAFDGYDFTVPHFAIKPIGPGLALLTNVGQGDKLSLAFQLIEKWSETIDTGSCKRTDLFTAHAAPKLTASCVKCHGGMDPMYLTAKNALDMTRVKNVSSAMDQEIACAQVRSRVNAKTPAQSQLFVVTRPGSDMKVNHPFQFADQASFDAFAAALSTWIVAE